MTILTAAFRFAPSVAITRESTISTLFVRPADGKDSFEFFIALRNHFLNNPNFIGIAWDNERKAYRLAFDNCPTAKINLGNRVRNNATITIRKLVH